MQLFLENKEDGLDTDTKKDIFEKNGIKKDDLYYYKVADYLITKREIGYLLNNDWLSDTVMLFKYLFFKLFFKSIQIDS